MQRITNNWSLKLVSVALAIMLWSHVRGEVNPLETATVDVPLRVRPPRGFALLSGKTGLPTKVSVVLRGPRASLRNIKGGALANPLAPTEQAPNILSGDVRASLEISRPREGEQQATVRATTQVEDVVVLGVKPDKLSVVLGRAPAASAEVSAAPQSRNLRHSALRTAGPEAKS